MKPRLPLSLYQTHRTLYTPAAKGFTVSQIFSDARTAEYAAATAPETDQPFPNLNHLPEVFEHLCRGGRALTVG